MTAHLERLQELTPYTAQKVVELLKFAGRRGIVVTRIDAAHRSCAAQNAIFDSQDESAPTVTRARGCQSWHPHGRAVDLRVQDDDPDDYAVLGEAWKRGGGIWGGDFDFDDVGHFEWHPGLRIADVCPSPDSPCPAPPFPEDRPFWSRPGGRVVLGLGFVAAAGVIVYRTLK